MSCGIVLVSRGHPLRWMPKIRLFGIPTARITTELRHSTGWAFTCTQNRTRLLTQVTVPDSAICWLARYVAELRKVGRIKMSVSIKEIHTTANRSVVIVVLSL